jgi:hypothetical protein
MMRLRERPTVTGLALALGFTTRLALIGYQNRDEFKDVIERAKLTVEKYYESGTVEGSVPQIAGIFALKNFGWADTYQINTNDNNESLNPDDIKRELDAIKRKGSDK